MARVVLIDSDVLIGAAIENDQNHNRAKPIVDGIDDGILPCAVISDYIYMEVVNHLTKKLHRADRIDFLERLDDSKFFRVYRVADNHFFEGKSELYFEYNQLSLTDAVSVAFMRDTSTQYLYSFDDDFDEVQSVCRINAAENPFW